MTFLIFSNVFVEYKNHLLVSFIVLFFGYGDADVFMQRRKNKKAPKVGYLRGLKIKKPRMDRLKSIRGGYCSKKANAPNERF